MPNFMALERDFHGYGETPPTVQWPGGARIAVQLVLNYEEGAESNVLDGDGGSESYLAEVVGIPSWPGQRHPGTESIYEYGSRAGFWRLHRILREAGVPATVFGVAQALARNPAAARAMVDAGWEVAGHGLRWIDHKDFDADAEREHFSRALAIFDSLGIPAPQGWYTGRTSAHTIDIAATTAGIRYSSDVYSDDLPYWVEGSAGPFLMIPYALDTNDMRFCALPGLAASDQFFGYLKDAFDMLYEEGLTAPRMMSVGLHGRLSGRPARAVALRRFLEYARFKPDVWFARRCDIADHWYAHHPYQAPAAGTAADGR